MGFRGEWNRPASAFSGNSEGARGEMNARALFGESPPWWFKSLEKYGFAALVAAYLAVKVVDPLLHAHFQAMDAMQHGMRMLEGGSQQMTESLRVQAETLRRIEDNTAVLKRRETDAVN
jgi:hypothetical protein